MKRFVSLFKNRAILITAIITFFLASAIIIIALFMGRQAGNFVIEVESGDSERKLHITENLSEDQYEKRIEVEGLRGVTDTTWNRFESQIESSTAEGGLHVIYDNGSPKKACVYSYTFFVVNDTQQALEIQSTMSYSKVSKNVDKAIRIMTISQGRQQCYQAPDDVETDYGTEYPVTENFLGNGRVYQQVHSTLEPETNMKYSVLIWLEGQDADDNDSILQGTIRFTLQLSVL